MTTSLARSSFAPFIDSESQVLILGTAPGELSLKQNQYYANPKNQFWYILEKAYDGEVGQTYEAKLTFLQNDHVALWDVLETFERKGSLDSSLRQTKPNDFARFLQAYPSLRHIVFNGSKAQKLFRQLVQRNLGEAAQDVNYITLPSTSSTPGKHVKTTDDKIEEWAVLKNLAQRIYASPLLRYKRS